MILPLEKQVSNPELSKRLKELGVPQESAFWWHRRRRSLDPDDLEHEWVIRGHIESSNFKREENYTAFTVAELGEMLPTGFISWKFGNEWTGDRLEAGTNHTACMFGLHIPIADTEADARAKCLAYLIEKGIIHV